MEIISMLLLAGSMSVILFILLIWKYISIERANRILSFYEENSFKDLERYTTRIFWVAIIIFCLTLLYVIKMNVTRKSLYSGIERTLDLPVTERQLIAWENGQYAQTAFPDCTPAEREFIMTGVTSEEWETMFSATEEDEA